jgi:hypothetical protein
MEEEAKKSDVNLAETITKLAITSKDADNILKKVSYREMPTIFADQWRPRIRVQKRGVTDDGYSCAHHVTWSPYKLWRSTSYLNYTGDNELILLRTFQTTTLQILKMVAIDLLGCSLMRI